MRRGTAVGGRPSSGLQRNVDAIAKIETAVAGERTPGLRIGRVLIRHIGKPVSVILHLIAIVGWIAWNGDLARAPLAFDPFPFPLLGLLGSLEGVMLGLLILATQGRLQVEADRRSHLNLQINMLAEAEATKMLAMLDALCRRLDVEFEAGDSLDDLKTETDPAHIADSLRRSLPPEG